MNLQENYKRLFKGRIRSNDSKLISEMESEKELEYLFGPSDKNPKTKNFYLTLLMRAQKEMIVQVLVKAQQTIHGVLVFQV